MKVKELEKLFKDKLAKDGISKDWMNEKLVFVSFDDDEEEE